MPIQSKAIIRQSREFVWRIFTNPRTWKEWYGDALQEVTPGWQEDGYLNWKTGSPSRIAEFVPLEKVTLIDSSSNIKTEFTFAVAEDEATLVVLQQNHSIPTLAVTDQVTKQMQTDATVASLKRYAESYAGQAAVSETKIASKDNQQEAIKSQRLKVKNKSTHKITVKTVYGGPALPDCCVYCCKPANQYDKVKLVQHYLEGFKQMRRTLSFQIPYCLEHHKLAHRLALQQFNLTIMLTIVFALSIAGLIAIQPEDVREHLLEPWSGALLGAALSFYPISRFVVPNLLVRFNDKHRDLKSFGVTDTLGIGAQMNTNGISEFEISNAEYFHRFIALNGYESKNITVEEKQPPGKQEKPKRIWQNGRFYDDED